MKEFIEQFRKNLKAGEDRWLARWDTSLSGVRASARLELTIVLEEGLDLQCLRPLIADRGYASPSPEGQLVFKKGRKILLGRNSIKLTAENTRVQTGSGPLEVDWHLAEWDGGVQDALLKTLADCALGRVRTVTSERFTDTPFEDLPVTGDRSFLTEIVSQPHPGTGVAFVIGMELTKQYPIERFDVSLDGSEFSKAEKFEMELPPGVYRIRVRVSCQWQTAFAWTSPELEVPVARSAMTKVLCDVPKGTMTRKEFDAYRARKFDAVTPREVIEVSVLPH